MENTPNTSIPDNTDIDTIKRAIMKLSNEEAALLLSIVNKKLDEYDD